MKPRRKSIQPAFVLRMCLLAMFIALAFVLMSLLFLFTAEDEFLDRILAEEEATLVENFERTGTWEDPRTPGMELYFSQSALPDGIDVALAQNPRDREFYGRDGRHYHLAKPREGVFLLYEVSGQLVIRNMRTTLLIMYGALALLVTGIAAIVAFSLARRTIRPITDLADQVSAIAPNSPPGQFASAYPENEIGELANKLETSLSRLHAFSEREAQFSRDVSHDLRTPLSVVTGAVELLSQDDLAHEKRARLIDRIAQATGHMSLTVSALLSMAREDRREGAKPQSVAAAIQTAVLNYRHFLDAKSVELIVEVPDKLAVRLQEGVLEIILSNILSNAFQYTRQGSIRIDFVGKALRITDTGLGVPAELRDRMFEPAAQGEHSSGYGLGLSIIHRLCERHSIDIDVNHLDDGTQIELRFPELVS